MTKLLKNEPQTLGISIRQARLVENYQQLHTSTQESKDDTEQSTCQYYHHDKQQMTWRSLLTTINEHPLDHVDKPSMRKLEFKISNASCHKRKRGRIRKLKQHMNDAQKLIDSKGIIQCQILKSQNDSGASHCLTNNKHVLKNYGEIPPLAINGVNSGEAALHATGMGYIPMKFYMANYYLLNVCILHRQKELSYHPQQ